MIHWTKFLLKTKISPMNHIFKDDLNKYFPKESIKEIQLFIPQINPKSFFTLELFTLVWEHLMPNVSNMIHVNLRDLWPN